jgi:hypothetical protein
MQAIALSAAGNSRGACGARPVAASKASGASAGPSMQTPPPYGCSEVQGFLYWAPMPAALRAALRQQRAVA